jgi:N-acetylmuramoyl-L-alanine amidase
MKKFLVNLLLIFTFILVFVGKVVASEDFNITSVTYDNSSSFLSINSTDSTDYEFSAIPKLYIVESEKKAYFDINTSILKCSARDLVVSTSEIKEVMVKQFSTNPNIVRVVIYYNDGYNPKNIQLRRINNTLFVRFKQTQIQNYYFQQVYGDLASRITRVYENSGIQTPVLASDTNMLNQINSAFKLGETTDDKNYILNKKEIILPTKYYIDNVYIKNNRIYLSGIGSVTITKPFELSNPTRLVYDIPNSIVNSSIRNKEISISANDSIKVGQFDKDTARIVITSSNANSYSPVIYPDTQQIVFINKVSDNYSSLYSEKSTLSSVNDEVYDSKTHAVKMVFSKPLIYGIERTSTALTVLLYNVEKVNEQNLKSAFSLDGAKFGSVKGGGTSLSIPSGKIENVDIHIGADGKTLRIKIKSAEVEKPKVVEPEIVITPIQVTPKKSTKKLVVVDAGHGGSDCGATRNGIYEKDITLDVAKRLETLLKKKGFDVVMTRSTDATVSLQERVEISENASPEIFVSVHVNSSNSESPSGLETHYYKDNSLKLAKTVHASLLNNINAINRGLFKSKFYVINHTTAPAILVEIGFISNNSERALLVSESRKQATAKAIAEGIYEYLK